MKKNFVREEEGKDAVVIIVVAIVNVVPIGIFAALIVAATIKIIVMMMDHFY